MNHVTCALAALLLLQDGAALKAFGPALDKAEKIGWTVPDLPQAVAELVKLAEGHGNVPQDQRDRLTLLQAQASVLSPLHQRLSKAAGSFFEFPAPQGKTQKLKVVGVGKSSVKVEQMGGQQEIRFADLDPEWIVRSLKTELASRPLDSGLVLAKAGRWDAAFALLKTSDSKHPLVAETRRRGLDSMAAKADGLTKASQWAEALDAWREFAALAAEDPRVEAGRTKIREGLIAAAKEASRAKKKAEMNAMLDLLKKNFPDTDAVAAEIRDAARWSILNAASFGLTGSPWKVVGKTEFLETAELKLPAGDYDGFSVRVRLEGEATGAVYFDNKNWALFRYPGTNRAYLSKVETGKDSRTWKHESHADISTADDWVVSIFALKGEYLVRVNGEEIGRIKTSATKLSGVGLMASKGAVLFDQAWLRKKE